jgi:hypothetical protein
MSSFSPTQSIRNWILRTNTIVTALTNNGESSRVIVPEIAGASVGSALSIVPPVDRKFSFPTGSLRTCRSFLISFEFVISCKG